MRACVFWCLMILPRGESTGGEGWTRRFEGDFEAAASSQLLFIFAPLG